MQYGVHEEVTDDIINEVYYKFDKEEKGINVDKSLYQINIKNGSRQRLTLINELIPILNNIIILNL